MRNVMLKYMLILCLYIMRVPAIFTDPAAFGLADGDGYYGAAGGQCGYALFLLLFCPILSSLCALLKLCNVIQTLR